jgi:uncharacterized Zn finger protein
MIKITKILTIAALTLIASCSEQKQEQVTQPNKSEVPQENLLLTKIELNVIPSEHLKFYVRNLSDKPLMALDLKDKLSQQSVKHIFANGRLFPGTSRIVNRSDVLTNKQVWDVTHLSFAQ